MARDLYASLFADPRFLGFGSLFKELDSFLHVSVPSYPPYNIEVIDPDEDGNYKKFKLVMAVAGFSKDDLTVSVQGHNLWVAGNKRTSEGKKYLHQGLANRTFNQTFKLAQHVEVIGSSLVDGILEIYLERHEPEEIRKAKQIEIKTELPALPKTE